MNILLCCAAGMSTSLLVQKMEAEAKNMGLDAKIWAVSVDEIRNHIDKADVLLVGPQIRYKLASLKELGKEKGIPVEMINTVDYGTLNGKNVVNFALKLLNK
ncbi:PTS sugar transporter subunit IIB [Fonticella tunisiensis]|uniref:PTS system lichenan oligosaccharide-specific IIB component (Lac family) n=1 Tax=Fonticella tunisiensis TaxID=1096341 RepID=A0A4R7KAK7_9CLOT|nr:PTS sugar transporter subunit IIB [Fonticella tunisiensis]TDT51903.1 PTS system lichenan oligosaccharide-specific IIB component (Lac family) [Fonticella tunisiensis]